MKNLVRLLIILFLLVSGVLSHGTDVTDLVDKPTRPTIGEIKEVADQLPRNIPYPHFLVERHSHTVDFEKWLAIMKQEAPEFIATLEKSFPGATWAFIGRDMQAIADLVESFYESIGQHGRVVRLDCSSPTFIRASPNDIVDYVTEHGFSLKTFKTDHPFILVDAVSGGYGSQGRQIIDAVYSKYRSQGGKPAELLRKFNFLGLIVSTFNNAKNKPNPVKQFDERIRDLEYYYLTHSKKFVKFGEKFWIWTYEAKNDFNESGYYHFVGGWHGQFGSFQRDKEGKVFTEPLNNSPDYTKELRFSVMRFQRDLIEMSSALEFLERVKGAAKEMGYEFPTSRPNPVDTSFVGQLPIEQAMNSKERTELLEFNELLLQNDKRMRMADYMAILNLQRSFDRMIRSFEEVRSIFEIQNPLNRSKILLAYKVSHPKVPTLTLKGKVEGPRKLFLENFKKWRSKQNLYAQDMLTAMVEELLPVLQKYNQLGILSDEKVKELFYDSFPNIILNFKLVSKLQSLDPKFLEMLFTNSGPYIRYNLGNNKYLGILKKLAIDKQTCELLLSGV